MLMGLDYYFHVVSIQKNFDFKFNNLIQTNGVGFNENWVSFFKNNGFKIGISFDGSILANKIHRQRTEHVVKNIRLLNKNLITPSLICVISDLNYIYYREMFEFLGSVDIEYVDLIPCYENNGKYSLSNQHYVEFMISLFDLWWNSERNINFRTFNNIVDLMLGKVSYKNFITCSLTGRCGEIISINSDKKIYFCDCLPKNETYLIGNLSEGLRNISKGNKYIALRENNEYIEDDCKTCEYLYVCGKGCLNRRMNSKHNKNIKDYYCDARKILFTHIKSVLGIDKICKTPHYGVPAFTRGPQPYEIYN